ncbi:hypothetical protein FQN57_002806 [Myotisia sp. PD_48]|nr:hypothetical protein FQN57_002806 [Myotisia sp. PD_48]
MTSESSSASPTVTSEEAKLSPDQFSMYNRMADRMELFHNGFRQKWTILYKACQSNKCPSNMTMHEFIRVGTSLCSQLDTHHTIEEQYIFPVLAKRMPAFKKNLNLINQHKEIHRGLDKLDAYLKECQSRERELRLAELKEVLDGFGTVLWEHLDDEVKELGAENMRKYWSLEDMTKMPM